MIPLSNGHVIKYVTASGAAAYNGRYWPWEQPLVWLGVIDPTLFTHVTKTLTYEPRRGNLRWWNPLGCIRVWADGTLNAVGLTNPGFVWWLLEVSPRIHSQTKLIVSLTGTTVELAKMAAALHSSNICGIEFNAHCPNTTEGRERSVQDVLDGCHVIREAVPDVPLLLKLSVDHPWRQIVERLDDSVEALSINSVSWRRVYPRRRSPLEHLGGGAVSGKRAQAYTWPMIKELVAMTDIPIIGCSAWEYKDMQRLWGMGVKAISFGAVHIPFPWRPTQFVRREQQQRRRSRRIRKPAASVIEQVLMG